MLLNALDKRSSTNWGHLDWIYPAVQIVCTTIEADRLSINGKPDISYISPINDVEGEKLELSSRVLK